MFYTAILGLILVTYTGILYFGQRYALYRDLDRELAIKAQEVTSAINSFLPLLENDQRAFRLAVNLVIRQQGEYPDQANIKETIDQWLAIRHKLNLRNDFIVLINNAGEEVSSSENVSRELFAYILKGNASAMQKTVSYRNINFRALRLRLIAIPYYYKNKRTYSILVGSSLVPIIRTLYGWLIFSSLIIPLVLIFAAFLGALIAQRILKPVMEVADIARNITYKDLSARVTVKQIDDELRYLVDAFNEMISRLEKSFLYIAEFSSNVAHELKTPLTIIRGESELALMKERDSREYQRVIKVTQEEADGMFKIVEDLLLLSRLEYQPQAFNFERLDFSLFIKEVFGQAKKIAAQKNITVKLEFFDRPMLIYADELHLKRLFLNLLHNAVKFTPAGGRINIKIFTKGKNLKTAIKDSGVGIKPQDLSRIFERFSYIDSINQGNEKGTGLGLSIAQSIAKIHSGDILVKSELGKGSTFTVTLPLLDK